MEHAIMVVALPTGLKIYLKKERTNGTLLYMSLLLGKNIYDTR
jgi:hypothetical protein